MKRQIDRRGFLWSETVICVAIGLGPLSLGSLSLAETPPGRFLIEEAQIIAAMGERQLPVDDVQVQLATPITASASAARIEVESVSPTGPHQLRLRLACRDRGQCLPFLATVTYPDGVDVSTLPIGRDAKAAAELRPGMQRPAAADAARSVKTAATKGGAVIQAGSVAMLEFESDRIHVRMEVISLQNGVRGSRVRVSSVDHKQIYTAEVITPTVLKGELSR